MAAMSLFILDRFEEGFALLEDESKALHRVARCCLPPEAKEGDCLRLRRGRYSIDEAATAARAARIRTLFERLTQKHPRE
jgi:hypothetical protein